MRRRFCHIRHSGARDKTTFRGAFCPVPDMTGDKLWDTVSSHTSKLRRRRNI